VGRNWYCGSATRKRRADWYVQLDGTKGKASMTRKPGKRLLAGSVSMLLLGAPAALEAASPSAEQALKLAPIQKDVDYDTPAEAEFKNCTIKGEKIGDDSAWVVRDAAGQTLRKFVDSNGDNVVDQWCYYRDGIEVYRDIDANHNGKADQYRWLATAGSRWGADENEDGRIDAWKQISAEEVTAEVVKALAEQDATRFARLLITDAELKSLGLGADQAKQVGEKSAAAKSGFTELARRQKSVTAKTNWIHFGGTKPGTVPAGVEGSTKDLLVYENVVAMVDTAGSHGQVQVGTLVRVGDVWRVIDLPRVPGDDKAEVADSGFFFKAPLNRQAMAGATEGPSGKTQQLLTELEALDKAAMQATSVAQQSKHHAQRADVLEQLASESATAEERAQWIRQLADSVSAAAQSGAYADGVQRLEKLHTRLGSDGGDKNLAAYVKFRYLTAEYGVSLQDPKVDFPKVQSKWLENLEKFVEDYPDVPDAAEAMMQLGIAQEFAGQEDEAKKWYGKVKSTFASTNSGKKAAGAITRLESVGQVIRLSGKTTAGTPIDLASFKGKLVLIHYWATWCQPCLSDINTIKQLHLKYGAAGFAPIGINLDSNPKDLAAFLQQNRLSWPQVNEAGSLEGRLANELGILTLPTMILVDKDGRVLNRNITIAEVEDELKKRVVSSGTARRPGN
jgi:thiol-disulfide isomerase/thioredoxin